MVLCGIVLRKVNKMRLLRIIPAGFVMTFPHRRDGGASLRRAFGGQANSEGYEVTPKADLPSA